MSEYTDELKYRDGAEGHHNIETTFKVVVLDNIIY